jgi:hypothetical protein
MNRKCQALVSAQVVPLQVEQLYQALPFVAQSPLSMSLMFSGFKLTPTPKFVNF